MVAPQLRKRPSTAEGEVSPPPPKRTATVKQASTTTKAAVASFFTPVSAKSKVEKLEWNVVNETLIVGKYNPTDEGREKDNHAIIEAPDKKVKIAAFDFDSTLIKTVSNSTFAKDANDWCWWHGSVPGKLKELDNEGYKLVIISNQGGIKLKSAANGPKQKVNRFAQFKQKSAAVFNQLDLQISLYAATDKDRYRKPATGMWDTFLANNSWRLSDIDLVNSIFVGDAGGRTAGTFNGQYHRADFSCSDRNLASNIGITYYTPEEYFLGEAARTFVRTLEPSALITSQVSASLKPVEGPEVILLVGYPGAGKSTYYQTYLAPLGYVRINGDTIGPRDKQVKIARDELRQGKSIAIDNTNPGRDTRKVWVTLANEHKIKIRVVHLASSLEIAQHNNSVRANAGLTQLNPEKRKLLPAMAFHVFGKNFEEPKLEEGFSEVIKVNFNFTGSEEEQKAWSRYWI